MKQNKLITGLCLTLVIALSTFSFPITSQADEPYTYTVKVYVGGTPDSGWTFKDAQGGEITDEGKCIVYMGLNSGTTIPFNPQEAVKLPDDNVKYGVKGIRRTGEDSLASNVITVTGDESYVVAYEFGKLVPYTVQFLNENGGKIIPDAEFYGVEGKSLKVGVKYLNNYTGIVSADDYVEALESGHVFKFVYTDNPNAKTIYNTSGGGVSYSTVVGNPNYVYQTIPGQTVPLAGEGGVTNNRGQGGGANAGAGEGQTAEGEGAVGITEPEVPLGGDKQEGITIPEGQVPEGIEQPEIKDTYTRYLIVISAIGFVILIMAIIGTYKMETDKRKNN